MPHVQHPCQRKAEKREKREEGAETVKNGKEPGPTASPVKQRGRETYADMEMIRLEKHTCTQTYMLI